VFKRAADGDIIIERTTEEKAAIVETALSNWVAGMVTFSKEYITAWDVVSDAIEDQSPYDVKTGVGASLGDDEFYWQDYLGKDYAVDAFKMERENGNEGDLLFISDYGLENLDKC
jgi:endo-1,4-beta-xylanase